MKKLLVVLLMVSWSVVALSWYPNPQLRLGIGVSDNGGNGVRVSQVFYGYPAYGNLQVGDIITYVDYVNSGPVLLGKSGLAKIGNLQVKANRPRGWKIWNTGQLQQIILGSPWNTVVVIWVERYGWNFCFIVRLLDPNSGGGVLTYTTR